MDAKKERAFRDLIIEVDFVIGGGDDEHDRCTECGLAGIGMLRDALSKAKAMFPEYSNESSAKDTVPNVGWTQAPESRGQDASLDRDQVREPSLGSEREESV